MIHLVGILADSALARVVLQTEIFQEEHENGGPGR